MLALSQELRSSRWVMETISILTRKLSQEAPRPSTAFTNESFLSMKQARVSHAALGLSISRQLTRRFRVCSFKYFCELMVVHDVWESSPSSSLGVLFAGRCDSPFLFRLLLLALRRGHSLLAEITPIDVAAGSLTFERPYPSAYYTPALTLGLEKCSLVLLMRLIESIGTICSEVSSEIAEMIIRLSMSFFVCCQPPHDSLVGPS